MTSFRCYEDSDINGNLLIINFCLCLVKLWKSFFHIFIHSDIVKRGVKGGSYASITDISMVSEKLCRNTLNEFILKVHWLQGESFFSYNLPSIFRKKLVENHECRIKDFKAHVSRQANHSQLTNFNFAFSPFTKIKNI